MQIKINYNIFWTVILFVLGFGLLIYYSPTLLCSSLPSFSASFSGPPAFPGDDLDITYVYREANDCLSLDCGVDRCSQEPLSASDKRFCEISKSCVDAQAGCVDAVLRRTLEQLHNEGHLNNPYLESMRLRFIDYLCYIRTLPVEEQFIFLRKMGDRDFGCLADMEHWSFLKRPKDPETFHLCHKEYGSGTARSAWLSEMSKAKNPLTPPTESFSTCPVKKPSDPTESFSTCPVRKSSDSNESFSTCPIKKPLDEHFSDNPSKGAPKVSDTFGSCERCSVKSSFKESPIASPSGDVFGNSRMHSVMEIPSSMKKEVVIPFCYYSQFSLSQYSDVVFWPNEYFTYLSYGIPDSLDALLDYSNFGLCIHSISDIFRFIIDGILGDPFPLPEFFNGTTFLSSSLTDIRVIGLFLYNHMYLQLFLLGFIFLIVIVGVIPLLLNRNLRVRRQEIYEQQKTGIKNHVVLYS